MTDFAIDLADIQQAALRIRSRTVQTPCVENERISQELDCELFFKAENLQHIGAFKARGALNAVLSLDEAQAQCGVVTHSSGNHAAALSRAASIRRIAAHVVMPANSAKNKIEAVRRFGVEPSFCEPNAAARAKMADDVQRQTGATLVHPYNTPAVMAGQGTVGLELLEQLENLHSIVVPVGGGGLLSGVLVAVKALNPKICVFAAEPELADDAFRSMQTGHIEQPTNYETVADGLRTPLGDQTFPIIYNLVDEVLLASESRIIECARQLVETARLVVEPSGAVGLAAIKQHVARFAGQRVAVVITGGNVDMDQCQYGSKDSKQ